MIATLAVNLSQIDIATSSRGGSSSSSAEVAATANARPSCSALEQVQQALQEYWGTLAGLVLEGRADLLPAFNMSDVVSITSWAGVAD
jgi:hypothetical protein